MGVAMPNRTRNTTKASKMKDLKLKKLAGAKAVNVRGGMNKSELVQKLTNRHSEDG